MLHFWSLRTLHAFLFSHVVKTSSFESKSRVYNRDPKRVKSESRQSPNTGKRPWKYGLWRGLEMDKYYNTAVGPCVKFECVEVQKGFESCKTRLVNLVKVWVNHGSTAYIFGIFIFKSVNVLMLFCPFLTFFRTDIPFVCDILKSKVTFLKVTRQLSRCHFHR